MPTDFSSAFSKIRHEKGISQREAASDLGVSQALLSHYENGVREPKLEFLVKACSYYGVSADYLLGITNVRENPFTLDKGLPGADRDCALTWEDQNVSGLLNILTATFRMLFYTCGSSSVERGSLYLRSAVYKLLRYVELAGGFPREDIGTVPGGRFRSLCDAAMCITESSLAADIEEAAKKGSITAYYKDLEETMPAVYRKFLDMIKQADAEINRIAGRG